MVKDRLSFKTTDINLKVVALSFRDTCCYNYVKDIHTFSVRGRERNSIQASKLERDSKRKFSIKSNNRLNVKLYLNFTQLTRIKNYTAKNS